MKTKLLLPAILTFSFLLSPFSFFLAEGQVPEGFNYQAVATYSGSPVTTAITVRITIQATEGGGETFWIEDHTGVIPNSQGLFNIVIGNGVKVAGSTASTFADIDWSVSPKYLKTDIDYLGWKPMGVSKLQSVPYSMVAEKIVNPVNKIGIKGVTSNMEEALFEVKNLNGQTVFAVYNEGVRIYVDDGSKGSKGGFAIGGFDVEEKGLVPGPEFLVVDPTKIRMYIDKTAAVKSPKGGFAIGGFDDAKGYPVQTYMRITNDSTKFFINDDPATKGPKGGFAIGGFDEAKGVKNFFNVESPLATPSIINPSENRILFHPLKNAFLVGKVLITDIANVGENSFVSGFESKAKGMYSQSLGYKTIALGDYSTAIGKNAEANSNNSFAFGDGAKASQIDSYAFGAGAFASGTGSYAIGSVGRDTLNAPTSFATAASGAYSFAMGMGSLASATGAFAIGINAVTSGLYGLAMGQNATTSGTFGVTIGGFSSSNQRGSISIGYSNSSNSWYAISMGYKNQASGGTGSTAIGYQNSSNGMHSYAIGYNNYTSNISSVALGNGNNSKGFGSLAVNSYNESFGNYSLSSGVLTQASGTASLSAGWETKATGSHAASFGYNTVARARSSFVVGEYNDTTGITSTSGFLSTYPLFVVGNGTDNTLRANAFSVLRSGNVGIGIITPEYLLDVSGTSRTTSDTYLATTTGNVGIGSLSALYKLDVWGTARTLGDTYLSTASGNVGIGDVGASYKLDVNGTLRNRLSTYLATSSGNVGIGTESPVSKLDVAGALNLNKGLTGTALKVNGSEALWFQGTYFSWGYGGTANYFYRPVGIGTTNPNASLHVSGNAGILTLEGTDHCYIQFYPDAIAGGRKAYIGYPGADNNDLNVRNDIGNGNIVLSTAANGDVNLTTSAYGHINLTTGTDGDIVLNPNGSVGVNNSSPSFKLDVSGTMRVTGALNFMDPFNKTVYTCRPLFVTATGEVGGINGSSIRYKENVFDLSSYDWLYNLRPVIYNYKNTDPSDLQYGMIAEEVDQVNPLLVIYKDNKPEGLMYEKLTVPMLKAIQEQQKQINSLREENLILKEKLTEVDNLKSELAQIKALLQNQE